MFEQNLGSQMFRSFKLVDMQIRVWRSQPAVVPSTQTTHDYGDCSLGGQPSVSLPELPIYTLEYEFHQTFSVMYSEQREFSNAM